MDFLTKFKIPKKRRISDDSEAKAAAAAPTPTPTSNNGCMSKSLISSKKARFNKVQTGNAGGLFYSGVTHEIHDQCIERINRYVVESTIKKPIEASKTVDHVFGTRKPHAYYNRVTVIALLNAHRAQRRYDRNKFLRRSLIVESKRVLSPFRDCPEFAKEYTYRKSVMKVLSPTSTLHKAANIHCSESQRRKYKGANKRRRSEEARKKEDGREDETHRPSHMSPKFNHDIFTINGEEKREETSKRTPPRQAPDFFKIKSPERLYTSIPQRSISTASSSIPSRSIKLMTCADVVRSLAKQRKNRALKSQSSVPKDTHPTKTSPFQKVTKEPPAKPSLSSLHRTSSAPVDTRPYVDSSDTSDFPIADVIDTPSTPHLEDVVIMSHRVIINPSIELAEINNVNIAMDTTAQNVHMTISQKDKNILIRKELASKKVRIKQESSSDVDLKVQSKKERSRRSWIFNDSDTDDVGPVMKNVKKTLSPKRADEVSHVLSESDDMDDVPDVFATESDGVETLASPKHHTSHSDKDTADPLQPEINNEGSAKDDTEQSQSSRDDTEHIQSVNLDTDAETIVNSDGDPADRDSDIQLLHDAYDSDDDTLTIVKTEIADPAKISPNNVRSRRTSTNETPKSPDLDDDQVKETDCVSNSNRQRNGSSDREHQADPTKESSKRSHVDSDSEESESEPELRIEYYKPGPLRKRRVYTKKEPENIKTSPKSPKVPTAKEIVKPEPDTCDSDSSVMLLCDPDDNYQHRPSASDASWDNLTSLELCNRVANDHRGEKFMNQSRYLKYLNSIPEFAALAAQAYRLLEAPTSSIHEFSNTKYQYPFLLIYFCIYHARIQNTPDRLAQVFPKIVTSLLSKINVDSVVICFSWFVKCRMFLVAKQMHAACSTTLNKLSQTIYRRFIEYFLQRSDVHLLTLLQTNKVFGDDNVELEAMLAKKKEIVLITNPALNKYYNAAKLYIEPEKDLVSDVVLRLDEPEIWDEISGRPNTERDTCLVREHLDSMVEMCNKAKLDLVNEMLGLSTREDVDNEVVGPAPQAYALDNDIATLPDPNPPARAPPFKIKEEQIKSESPDNEPTTPDHQLHPRPPSPAGSLNLECDAGPLSMFKDERLDFSPVDHSVADVEEMLSDIIDTTAPRHNKTS